MPHPRAGKEVLKVVKEAMSRAVARAAIRIALTEDRDEEKRLVEEFARQGILAAGVDYGGEFTSTVRRIIERAVISAKREGVITGTHAEEGAVAGAAHEAIQQLLPKALGLNIGGKVGVARGGGHVAVAMYAGIGLLHLDDVAISVGHRAVPAAGENDHGAG